MSRGEDKIVAAALLLAAGGIIGAGVALLFAPQSGQRTRRDICKEAKKIKHRADESVDELSANIQDLVEIIEDKTDDLLEKGKDLADSKRKDLMNLIEDGAAKLQGFRSKLGKL